MSARRPLAFALVAAAAAAVSCATLPGSDAPARVSVEVLRGFLPAELSQDENTAPVVVILDSTDAMAAATELGVDHHVAAQRSATRFIGVAPAQRPVWLYAMGSGESTDCQTVYRGARAPTEAERRVVLDEIASLKPGGRGALTAALEGVLGELQVAGQVDGSRVVAFSRLSSECAGDVCTAAAALVEAGVRLDVVAIGDASVPACLREPGGLADASPPPPAHRSAPVHFRVERSEPEPMTLGCSHAGGLPIGAPPGRATLVVELDPPLRVDAYLAPGRRHVLQVVDFPSLDPPARQWRWLDTAPVSAGNGR